MNVEVVVEPELCIKNQEEEVDVAKAAQKQGEIHLWDIQWQVKMESYTVTISVFVPLIFLSTTR